MRTSRAVPQPDSRQGRALWLGRLRPMGTFDVRCNIAGVFGGAWPVMSDGPTAWQWVAQEGMARCGVDASPRRRRSVDAEQLLRLLDAEPAIPDRPDLFGGQSPGVGIGAVRHAEAPSELLWTRCAGVWRSAGSSAIAARVAARRRAWRRISRSSAILAETDDAHAVTDQEFSISATPCAPV